MTQFYYGTPYASGTRYVAGAQDNGTLRGSDGTGANAWSEISGGDGGYTAINPATSGASTVLYVENTGVSIQKSSDDGNSFTDAIDGIAGSGGCGRFINPFVLDPNSPTRLYTTQNVIWRTSNSAFSWLQASDALPGTSCGGAVDSGERFSALAVADGNANLLVAGSNFGRLCRLTNATGSGPGTALQNCSTPAGGGVVSDIAFDPNDPTRVYASYSTISVSPLWRSTNSGQTWSDISGAGVTGLPDVGAHSIAVSPFAADTIYVGTDVGVFVTTNGGASWARENTGFANVRTDRLAFNAVGTDSAQLFAFTHGRGVFRTTVPAPPPSADLAISVSDGASSINAGAAVTYAITVANPIAKTVPGATVSDAFPAALSACTWTCSANNGGSCPASGSGNIAAAVTLGPSGTATFTAQCTLSAAATGTLSNTAGVAYAQDPTAANNSATDVDTIVPRADVAVSVSDGVASVAAGGPVAYTIVVSNNASVAIAGVALADTFPPALAACAWTCAAGAGSTCPAAGSGNIAAPLTLAAKGSATFSAGCTLSADATGVLADTAVASYANDTVVSNNAATDTDTVQARADLSLDLSRTPGGSLLAGASTGYVIHVIGGAHAVSGARLVDHFPPGFACQWTCLANGGSCPASGNGDIDANVALGAGGVLTVNASCAIPAGATAAADTTATVTYANDPNAANDIAVLHDAVVPQADVAVALTDGVSFVAPGGAVYYRIDVTNLSPLALSEVLVQDAFPAALGGCAWTCAATEGGSCSASGNGDIDQSIALAAHGGASFLVACTLAPDAVGVLGNTAQATAPNDPAPANNAAADQSTISAELIYNDGFEL